MLDGLGTFLDAIYLDKFELISEDTALIAYEFTFLVFAILGIIYLKSKNENVSLLLKEKYKGIAAVFETLGQFFYVFAMSSDSTIGATIVGSLMIGVSRTAAANFTFLLAIPVMFGASLLKLVKFGLAFSGSEVAILATGMIVAFVISVIVIKFLMSYIRKHDFKVFGWYRIILGVVVLAYFFLK